MRNPLIGERCYICSMRCPFDVVGTGAHIIAAPRVPCDLRLLWMGETGEANDDDVFFHDSVDFLAKQEAAGRVCISAVIERSVKRR